MKLTKFSPTIDDIKRYPHFETSEKCWKSEDGYIEVLLNKVGNFIHLKIHNRDDSKIYGFYLLQNIKDIVLGPNTIAVQIFPKNSELVDKSNTYHLWTWDKIEQQVPNLYKIKRYD